MSEVTPDKARMVMRVAHRHTLNYDAVRKWFDQGITEEGALNAVASLANYGYSVRSVDMAVLALAIAHRQEKGRIRRAPFLKALEGEDGNEGEA